MKQQGLIYQARKIFWQKRIGLFCLVLSLIGFLLFSSPLLTPKLIQEEKSGFAPLLSQEIKAAPKKEEVIKESQPVIENFFLTIEKIGLHHALVLAQVKSASQEEYQPALQKGLVQPEGSGFPGEGRLVYIFGHSTNYPWLVKEMNALFYQLDKLALADRIKIEYQGKHFVYYVFDKRVAAPEEIDLIKQNLDKDVLVLQTCYPLGTTWKRLLIFCQPSKFGSLLI